MKSRLQTIVDGILATGDITIVKPFEADSYGIVQGQIVLGTLELSLQFELTIYPPYPMQFHDTETIRFVNTNLIGYSHVNSDGSLCVHTPHNTDLKSKIYYDLQSLKEWVAKYYVAKENDKHYDHIMVMEDAAKQHNSTFLFTSVDHRFSKGDFGSLYSAPLAVGTHFKKHVFTYVIQGFKINKTWIPCKWNSHYSSLSYQKGLFVFSEMPPVRDQKFVVENWTDIERYVTQDFIKLLYELKKDNDFNKRGIKEIPVFIGYRIPGGIHWQCALIDVNNFPIYTEKSGKCYVGRFANMPINWALTRNCSYELFFGRGAFCPEITGKRILIIGVGAIGSMVATTLTRGGCKFFSLADYDIKEPENVCRSEYKFSTGLSSKVVDLRTVLTEISPFVEVKAFPEFIDAIKQFINDDRFRGRIKDELEKYDLIFDCTADNDVAYVLETLSLSSNTINLSITNHAEELICTVKPNLYDKLMHCSSMLERTDSDVYNPTGCWSPTFKASYNDIAVMVQFALKNINRTLTEGRPLRSFYLQYDDLNLHAYFF